MQAGNGRAMWAPGGNGPGQAPLQGGGFHLAAEPMLWLWGVPEILATLGRTEWTGRTLSWCSLGLSHLWLPFPQVQIQPQRSGHLVYSPGTASSGTGRTFLTVTSIY